jgi:hypothetical protein
MSTPGEEIASAIREAHALTDALSDDLMQRRGPGGGWSAAQCLDHLTVTARRMMQAMDAAVETLRSQARPASGPYRPNVLSRLFLWYMEPPVRLGKTKTQPGFQGDPGTRPELVRQEFFAAHEELLRRVKEFEAWDQNARVVVSPFDPRGKLTYSLGLSLRVIPAHMRRHLWQATQAVRGKGRS